MPKKQNISTQKKAISKKISDLELVEELLDEYKGTIKLINFHKEVVEIIKERLQNLCDANPEWFVNDNGLPVKVKRFECGKVTYKKQADKFEFAKPTVELLTKFLKEYPDSLGFSLKNMANIPLSKFGITQTEGKTSLVIEVEL